MPKNPVSDVWQFLTGTTADHVQLGSLGTLLAVLYAILLIASVAIAIMNWRDDPGQRNGTHVGNWVIRVLIGTMWFEGMLWKLPLPLSDGLKYWTEQMESRAAFESHQDLVTDVILPNLTVIGPFVFLAEFTFAVAFLLGIGVRLAGLAAILFVTNLWLGIYRPGEPAEWPWSYVFLMMVMFFLVLHASGRSLGLDGWLRRHIASVRERRGVLGRFFHLAG